MQMLKYGGNWNNIMRVFVRQNSNVAKQVRLSKIDDIQRRIDSIPIENYRNFSIVAHIDHGKSTLSDRLLEITNVISKNSGNGERVLDKLEVEKERGITIKAQTCSMFYFDERSGKDHLLHLIDTPGHVDFRDEVSRSYKACNGAILLVDASKGVQSQTVANFYLAYSMGLKLIPVINKIDLNVADVERCVEQIESSFEMPESDIVKVSSKSGINIAEKLLPAIIDRIPPPTGEKMKPFRALLVDSWYDSYLGVILLVHVVDGSIERGDKISSATTQSKYEIKEIGIMYPDRTATDKLSHGQVGYIVPGMKNSQDAKIGDTFMQVGFEASTEVLPGFEDTKPMVFVGAFPADGVEFKTLDDDINRLVLNDKSVCIQRENSNALGQGWRLGFLGSLHASVFKERLEKEYGSKLIITQPTVPYLIEYSDGTSKEVTNPNEFPTLRNNGNGSGHGIKSIQEPYVEAMISLPEEYLGNTIKLCDAHRGKQLEIKYMDTNGVNQQIILRYELPLFELVDNFFGKLKSISQGYATLDYEDIGFKADDIVKLELLVNGTTIDALTTIMHRSKVNKVGTEWVKNFKKYVKSQFYEIVIQARVNNSKIIARETIKARRKDVLAKLHASDVSRRKKLLSKQKEGKRQMKLKSIGNIQINQDAYQEFLRR